MLFNSQIFLLGFLPLTVIGFYVAASSRAARTWLLVAASIVFYGYWDYRLVPLLVGSVCANWLLARACSAVSIRWIVAVGIVLNLSLLGLFKYADFFADTIAAVTGSQHDAWNITLPLGISFFTFQQISYLIELRRGDAPRYRFRDYFLYVAFFPQLIAGPIVRHNELIFQFDLSPLREGLYERISRGVFLLAIGLVKKVFVADELARIVDPLFVAAADGKVVTGAEAWSAAAGFSLQIYFDFSAYSDMAIGLALILGFTLPVNFNAPYRATTIREFWRRWHMTLSRFLRDYLYIPLGGNRSGRVREGLALATTMLLGGLWHGAGWTFVIWGGLHGLALATNHMWTRWGRPLPVSAGWALTFLFVMLAFVVFRAENLGAAQAIITSLTLANGVGTAPETKVIVLVSGALLATLIFPTSQKLALELLSPHPLFAIVTSAALVIVLLFVGSDQNAEFIYFQF